MLFAELDLGGVVVDGDEAFGPPTTRGEIPEALFWSTFCDVLERIEPGVGNASLRPPGSSTTE
jgi:hypothetical protein